MSEDNGIMQGMKEAGIFAMFKDVSIDRIIELASAEREGRVVIRPDCAVCKLRIATVGHPNCGHEQSCSGKKRASFFEPLADTEPKGGLNGK